MRKLGQTPDRALGQKKEDSHALDERPRTRVSFYAEGVVSPGQSEVLSARNQTGITYQRTDGPYRISWIASWDEALACASMAVPVCCSTCALARASTLQSRHLRYENAQRL